MINEFFITRQQDIQEKVYDLDILSGLAGATKIGFDTETTMLDPYTTQSRMVLLGLRTNTHRTYIIDLTTIPLKEIGKALEPYLDKVLWVAHNALFDLKWLAFHTGINPLKMRTWCTQVASQVLYNGAKDLKHGYDDLVSFHFHESIDKSVRENFINRNTALPITKSERRYLANDLRWLIPLQEEEEKYLTRRGMITLMWDVEVPFTSVLAYVIGNGVEIDQKKWLKNAAKTEAKLTKSREHMKEVFYQCTSLADFSEMYLKKAQKEAKARGITQLSFFEVEDGLSRRNIAARFNPNSHDQVKYILHKLGYKAESTGEEVIEKLLLTEEDELRRSFLNALLDVREWSKEYSSYGPAFLRHISPITGRIHTDYTQAVTVTGRLSSKNPNLQNIKGDEDIRSCITEADEDWDIATLDFDGQELRIVGAYSGEPSIIRNFTDGLDLHSILSTNTFRIVKKDEDFIVTKKVNGDLRDLHKRVLFGYCYGAGAPRIAGVLNIPLRIAELVLKALELALPVLAEYQKTVKTLVVQKGIAYDGTKYNRRRLFRNFRNQDLSDAKIESEGVNFPIQGTAATMTKLAMIRCVQYLVDNNLMDNIKLIMQVHDELVFKIHKNHHYIAYKMQEIMEETGTEFLRGIIPMKSSINIQKFWKK